MVIVPVDELLLAVKLWLSYVLVLGVELVPVMKVVPHHELAQDLQLFQ
jgi:hypothetical protein